MKTNRRQFIGGALGATALSGLASPMLGQNAPIRIGCITTLSGGYSLFGEAQALGMQMAIDEINANGGVGGSQLELVVRNDDIKPDVALAAARELQGEGVHIYAGVLASGVALALSGVMEELDSVFLNAASHGNNLTHEDFNKNYFRVTDYSAMRIWAAANLMADRYPDNTKWGAILPDAEIGRSTLEVFSARLPQEHQTLNGHGATIDEPVWTKFGSTDFRAPIARLMSQDIDGLFVGLGGADEVTFLQQAGQLGLTNKVGAIITSGSEFLTPIALKQRTPPNYWSGFHWYYGAYYGENPVATKVVDTYRAAGHGQHPDGFVGMGHTAIQAIAAGLEISGSTMAGDLVPALEGVTFETVKGPVELRAEDHQALCDVNYALIAGAENEDGWEVLEAAKVDGRPLAGEPSPGEEMSFG
ncbi:ABC transporter substrate-binding protein [Pseudoruegeria sp. HB172150]|uniref:ABC transporter substrate-binding protein n=1 Tax=Pseudoruegeria sp. HB172150 TaxID=2721164 RepID=UPI0015554E12|nr:ABC transporter substrate-binding protein [Pseudoruegeria sp. HB172150]